MKKNEIMSKTKIVCTIGPASESKEMLTKLVKAGMNVMRLNFSHGTHEEHEEKINTRASSVLEIHEKPNANGDCGNAHPAGFRICRLRDKLRI